MTSSRFRRLLTLLLLGTAVAVAVFFVWSQRAEIQQALSRLSAVTVTASLAAGAGAGGSTLLAWRVVMADLSAPLSLRAAGRIYFLGQLGKYLPGSVWPVLTQMELGRALGIGRATSAAAATLMLVLAAVTGTAVAVTVLPLTEGSVLADYAWVAFGVLPLLVLLVPAVQQRLVGWAGRVLSRPLAVPRTSARGTALAGALLLLGWALYGLHLHLLVSATCGCSPSPLLGIGVFALAWVCGFLVVIAPAGAGAREGVLVLGLAPVLSPAAALAVALVSRVLLTIADLVLAGTAALAARRHRPATLQSPPPTVP